MKKLLAAALALCMTSAVFTGCGSSDNSSSSAKDGASNAAADSTTNDSSAAAEESVSDKLLAEYPVSTEKVDVKNGATDNMIARSVINEGDTSRLAAKLDYALANPKETTKICFLGDSITAGSGANSSTHQYVNQFKSWWEENISYYVDVNNAGIGATDSYIGVHRAQRDALADNPDIIVIEFINDADNDFYESCMDSLVRMCLEQENNPAVMILEPSCEDGSSPQAAHLKVAQAYNIPMISYHDAVMPEIEAGNFTWQDISPDNVHPNDDGHVIMASLLTKFAENVKNNLDTEDKEAKAFDENTVAPTGDPFANATIGSRETSDIVKTTDEGSFTKVTKFQKFTDGWGTTTGGTATFEITAKNIGMIYYMTVDGSSATVAVKIDGEDVATINADFSGGWGNYAKAEQVYSSDEVATHTVEVTVIDDSKPNFEILNWLVS
ncbi:SGNH/GDSL hydrolase family protein [Ruminococcus sp.]|uniref:SGNH/GDSL hydrolase family protein n=1 Tax=Ruminococcus sp. TaxID=41978 RepID=UPI0025FE25E0|nr:SGNH/GDSL hydrolase family protein [Ruminococcus sp.]